MKIFTKQNITILIITFIIAIIPCCIGLKRGKQIKLQKEYIIVLEKKLNG